MPQIGKKNYDVRIIERKLDDLAIRKDYEKFLKNLLDDSENSTWTRPGEEIIEGPELEVVS